MESHLKEHSYRKLTFKCEDCDFLAEDKLSLEVHSGKKHSGNFECGLCGYKGEDIDSLETHIHTCETYTCKYCEITFQNITDMKSHLSSRHPKHIKHTDIDHIKMDRKNSEKVSINTLPGNYLF